MTKKIKNCENCKYSVPLDIVLLWNDNMQKWLEEEQENNKSISELPVKERIYRSYKNFWQIQHSLYLDDKHRLENNVTCRWNPNFVERKKTDLCGQWEKK